MEAKRKDTNAFTYLQNRNRLTDTENKLMVMKEDVDGVWGVIN